MPDIKQIAADCANRIFDRMELCRGSAMLKSDIEREVEMALREINLPEGSTLVDTEYDEHLGPVLKRVDPKCTITPKQAEERGIPMGATSYIWVIGNDDGETARVWNGINWVDDARVDQAKRVGREDRADMTDGNS